MSVTVSALPSPSVMPPMAMRSFCFLGRQKQLPLYLHGRRLNNALLPQSSFLWVFYFGPQKEHVRADSVICLFCRAASQAEIVQTSEKAEGQDITGGYKMPDAAHQPAIIAKLTLPINKRQTARCSRLFLANSLSVSQRALSLALQEYKIQVLS